MKLKKLIALLVAVACVITLAACGKNKGSEQESLPEKPEDVFDIMESIAEENSDADVSSYVMAAESDLTWEEVEGGVSITGYTGADTAIELPAQISGKNVVAIGSNAFSTTSVAGVKLPDTVETIEYRAFFYLGTLVEVKMGSGVKTIGEGAFQGCAALSNVELNAGLETIGDYSFCMCNSLKEINIPDTVSTLGMTSFGMTALETVRIPGSVQVVGKQAFVDCKRLKEVVIEDGVQELAASVFESCEALTRAELPTSIQTYGFYPFLYADNVTIYAPAGSAAVSFAEEYGIPVKNN